MVAANTSRPSMASHRLSRVWTLLATATWVCRSGSPARLSRWVNAVATRPRVSTCRTPSVPSRVNRAVLSRNASASLTAVWWARSIAAAVGRSAIAHSVLTLLTGENVRSYPATALVRGRECLAIVAASSRASAGSRPCSSRNSSVATWVRMRARSASGIGSADRRPRAGVEGSDLLRHPDAELRGVVGIDPKRVAQPRGGLLLALAEPGAGGGGAQLLGQRVLACAEQVAHLLGGDLVALVEPVDARHPGPDPRARRLALGRVVRREAGVALLGRVLGCDLAGQVVVPAPGRQLVDRHGHTPEGARRRPGGRWSRRPLPGMQEVCGAVPGGFGSCRCGAVVGRRRVGGRRRRSAGRWW